MNLMVLSMMNFLRKIIINTKKNSIKKNYEIISDSDIDLLEKAQNIFNYIYRFLVFISKISTYHS